MYELARMGVLTAVLFMGQVVLAFLPNVEIVGLLVILYMLFFGKKVFGILFAFVFLEGFFYGFGMWWFSYLYIWNLLALVVLLLPRSDSAFFWSMISGFFGLFFGALCALPCLAIGGWSAALSCWTAGLGFDLVHCAGNFQKHSGNRMANRKIPSRKGSRLEFFYLVYFVEISLS